MSLKILRHKKLIEKPEYYIFYEWAEQLDYGFMFLCNREGDINFNELSKDTLENYEKCENGEYEVVYQGLRRVMHKHWEHTIAECSCGSKITLSSNSNQCRECKSWYSFTGQQLH
jgi:hypothetical protein